MYISGVKFGKMFKTDPYMAWSFYVTSAVRVLYGKVFGKKLRLKHYAGKIVHTQEEGNVILREAILRGEPFFFGRNGVNELYTAYTHMFWKNGIIDRIELKEFDIPFMRSGIFPLEIETMGMFEKHLLEANQEVDLYGTFRMVLEDYYIRRKMNPRVQLTHLNMMDFWRYEIPFTSALAGKRVLVVHPLAKLIEKQYKKREVLFENPYVLPEFELLTYKAVQTAGGEEDERFKTWGQALDYMVKDIQKLDFDVAILGCGAYGMPLAASIKKQGKVAIYMGGVTQMLFGIKGGRWDKDPVASKLYNEHWVYPEEQDVPRRADEVEESCYW